MEPPRFRRGYKNHLELIDAGGLPSEKTAVRRLYFAYGSNMEPGPMAERCPHAQPMGRARLNRWSFRINERGYATVVPDPNGTVHGVLWSLTPSDEASLDDYEGLSEGLYLKDRLRVTLDPGVTTDALVYLARHTRPGRPLPGYLEGILEAARNWQLPEGYRSELEGWSGPLRPET
jgi:hypothetical protein